MPFDEVWRLMVRLMRLSANQSVIKIELGLMRDLMCFLGDITVIEAKGLNVKSAGTRHRFSCFVSLGTVLWTPNLTTRYIDSLVTDKPSVYCVLSVNNVHYNTSHSERGNKPEWKQKFTLYVDFRYQDFCAPYQIAFQLLGPPIWHYRRFGTRF